ncbi:MAG: hypothetical protein QXJ20_03025, partial [Candidatus Aenigmatarchaeota archaeon]
MRKLIKIAEELIRISEDLLKLSNIMKEGAVYYRIADEPRRLHVWDDLVEMLVQEVEDGILVGQRERAEGARWTYNRAKISFDEFLKK